MKYCILFAIGLAMTLPLQAAGNGSKRKPCPKPCPERVFKRKDKDHDGMLTKEEFIAKAKDAAKAGERFTKRDKNSDGKLTRAEFRGKQAGKKPGRQAGKKANRANKNK